MSFAAVTQAPMTPDEWIDQRHAARAERGRRNAAAWANYSAEMDQVQSLIATANERRRQAHAEAEAELQAALARLGPAPKRR